MPIRQGYTQTFLASLITFFSIKESNACTASTNKDERNMIMKSFLYIKLLYLNIKIKYLNKQLDKLREKYVKRIF